MCYPFFKRIYRGLLFIRIDLAEEFSTCILHKTAFNACKIQVAIAFRSSQDNTRYSCGKFRNTFCLMFWTKKNPQILSVLCQLIHSEVFYKISIIQSISKETKECRRGDSNSHGETPTRP